MVEGWGNHCCSLASALVVPLGCGLAITCSNDSRAHYAPFFVGCCGFLGESVTISLFHLLWPERIGPYRTRFHESVTLVAILRIVLTVTRLYCFTTFTI